MIVGFTALANIAMMPVVSAEKNVNAPTYEAPEVIDDFFASSEFERKISKEYSVGSSPILTISNEFGKINIIEGASDKIIFNITITGKGKNESEAKKYAETVDVKFVHSGNSVNAKTSFGKINCNNCGRTVDYEIAVPKNTKYKLENKFGDVTLNNTTEPAEIKVEFGKLFANELADADVTIQHGGSTINKCENMKLKSGFSKHKFGVIGSISGKVAHGGFDVEEIGRVDVVSEFSNVNIKRLKNSFVSNSISHGSLIIGKIDTDFSNIKIDANFSKVQLSLNNKHNFKAILHTNFGNIKTGDVVFFEKSLDKKDAVVGIAGKVKEPSATVNISNSHGNIVFD